MKDLLSWIIGTYKKDNLLGDKAYSKTQGLTLINDLRKVIVPVRKVFLVDPYLTKDYIEHLFCPENDGDNQLVSLHLLVGPKTRLNSLVIQALKNQLGEGVQLSIKVSAEIHDRVLFADKRCWTIGASIGTAIDASNVKPTYVSRFSDYNGMRKIYEPIWKGAEDIDKWLVNQEQSNRIKISGETKSAPVSKSVKTESSDVGSVDSHGNVIKK